MDTLYTTVDRRNARKGKALDLHASDLKAVWLLVTYIPILLIVRPLSLKICLKIKLIRIRKNPLVMT